MNDPQMNKGGRPQKDFAPRMGAGCLMVMGACMGVCGLLILSDGQKNAMSGMIFCLAIGAGLLGCGIFWYRFIKSRDLQRQDLYDEKSILGIAMRHGGHVTLAQIALESSYTAAEAQAAMSHMVAQGFAHPDLLDDGTVIYRFGGLTSDAIDDN